MGSKDILDMALEKIPEIDGYSKIPSIPIKFIKDRYVKEVEETSYAINKDKLVKLTSDASYKEILTKHDILEINRDIGIRVYTPLGVIWNKDAVDYLESLGIDEQIISTLKQCVKETIDVKKMDWNELSENLGAKIILQKD